MKHFSKIAIPRFDGESYYYTNSAHFREDAEIDLIEKIKKQEKFHVYIQSGAIEYISLKRLKSNELNLEDLIKDVLMNSKLAKLKFTS